MACQYVFNIFGILLFPVFLILILVTRGQRTQLIGHLVRGMVVIYRDQSSESIGMVKVINDLATPKPQFGIDPIYGTWDEPTFMHDWHQTHYCSKIIQV